MLLRSRLRHVDPLTEAELRLGDVSGGRSLSSRLIVAL
jgi:hypothetical protein